MRSNGGDSGGLKIGGTTVQFLFEYRFPLPFPPTLFFTSDTIGTSLEIGTPGYVPYLPSLYAATRW